MSDRDRDGLRGLVRTVVYERTFSGTDGQPLHTTSTTEYTRDGRILETRMENGWLKSYTYDSNGRLLKVTSGKQSAKPSFVEVYSYGEAGRLVRRGWDSDGEARRCCMPGQESGWVDYSYDEVGRLVRAGRQESGYWVSYQYDEHGHKTETQTFEERHAPPKWRFPWKGSELWFRRLPGGTFTTIYNKHDVAIEGQLHDAWGQLIGRVIPTFDAGGRIVGEKQIVDAPDLFFEGQFTSNSDIAEKRARARIASMMYPHEISYSYDAQGRLTEKRKQLGALVNEVTTVSYNEEGDKTEERTILHIRSGNMSRLEESEQHRETRYAYQYDSYGNWVEQTTVARSRKDAPLKPITIVHRRLTYY
jgi:YD repeat-containing protein